MQNIGLSEAMKSVIFNSWMTGANYGGGFAGFKGALKAMTGMGGTNEEALVGGSALRIQSLDPIVKDLIPKMDDFIMMKLLRRRTVFSMVDYWVKRTAIGGYPGSGWTTERATAKSYDQTVGRGAVVMKFCSHRGEVTHMVQQQEAINDPLVIEQQGVMTRVALDYETCILDGNESLNPNQFNGLRYIIENQTTTDHVLDARGRSPQWSDIIDSASFIRGEGNFGKLSDAVMSTSVLGDISKLLDDLPRAMFQEITRGGKKSDDGGFLIPLATTGIKTDYGIITPWPSIWVQEAKVPFAVKYPSTIGETGAPVVPAAVAGAAAAHASSLFASDHAGRYFYIVEAVNGNGYSNVTPSAAVDVASGDRVTITINASVTDLETGYRVYRTKKLAGTATIPAYSDFRWIASVGKTVGGVTTVYDTNSNIPGTSEMYLMTMGEAYDAIDLTVFAEPFQYPVYSSDSAVQPFLGIMAGNLRVTQPRRHRLIKNLLPSSATWKPFN